MEIELKYCIKDELVADKIWGDPLLTSCEEEDSREKLYMKSAYFDTEDLILSSNDIAFRVRMEGSRIVASLKWNGKTDGALHQRQEINVPLNDEACFLMPSPEIFKESEIGREVIELLKDKRLESIMEVNFIRRRFRIDTQKCIMEVSIDNGKIITEKGTAPISEVEIELFSGETEDLLEMGRKLSEKYELEEGLRSKYARGLELLGVSRV